MYEDGTIPLNQCVRIRSIKWNEDAYHTNNQQVIYANTENQELATSEFEIIVHPGYSNYYGIRSKSFSGNNYWQCKENGDLTNAGGTGTWTIFEIKKCLNHNEQDNCWNIYNPTWNKHLQARNDASHTIRCSKDGDAQAGWTWEEFAFISCK